METAPCTCPGRIVRTIALGALAAGLTACGGQGPDARALVATFDSLARRADWPGFEPSRIPLALWDGERSWLIRHPDPPPAFRRYGGSLEIWVSEARHPAMTANTSAVLAGFRTAILLADSTGTTAVDRRGLAATLVHEAFHVHQMHNHPGWAPNEVELLTYPVDDAEGLRRRRLETAALRRALHSEAPDSVRRLCWSRAWLRLRRHRMTRLPEGAAAYERGAELWEGLARYVESRALERDAPPALPAEGYPPEAVRTRAYDVGHALAWILDRVAPRWKGRLAEGETLEGALAEALDASDGAACRLAPDETRRALAVARADLERLAERRRDLLERFEAAPGWSVEIVASNAAPLFPSGFDPQNVDRLGERLVHHGRWLRLAGENGTVEVLERPALTEGVGPHPLFGGVASLRVTGLPSRPEVEEAGGVLRLQANGLTAELSGAALQRSGRNWRVVLSPPGF